MNERNMSGLIDKEIYYGRSTKVEVLNMNVLAPGLPNFKQGYASNLVYLSFLPLLERYSKLTKKLFYTLASELSLLILLSLYRCLFMSRK